MRQNPIFDREEDVHWNENEQVDPDQSVGCVSVFLEPYEVVTLQIVTFRERNLPQIVWRYVNEHNYQ
jgi:hypothetical protein